MDGSLHVSTPGETSAKDLYNSYTEWAEGESVPSVSNRRAWGRSLHVSEVDPTQTIAGGEGRGRLPDWTILLSRSTT